MINVIGFVGLMIITAIILVFFAWLNAIVRDVSELNKAPKDINPTTSTIEEWNKSKKG